MHSPQNLGLVELSFLKLVSSFLVCFSLSLRDGSHFLQSPPLLYLRVLFLSLLVVNYFLPS